MNSESLIPANPDILDGVDDLMQLSYLNEPSVLFNLQYRYNRDMIYVRATIILSIFKPSPEGRCFANVVIVIIMFNLDKSRTSFGCYQSF